MNGSLPKVTINIPTYNQERYIARAIESALKQDYTNLEIIVSDDCSTDNTYNIARKFESERVKVYRSFHNTGRVANYRNMLYSLSTGDWVVNLDGDDYYIDNKFISEAIHLIQQHKGVVMYAAGAKVYLESKNKFVSGKIHTSQDIKLMKGTEYVMRLKELGQVVQHFAVLYNRQEALQTNFYSLDSLGCDTDSLCRLALKGNVIVHKKYVGVWTSHGANASYTLNIHTVEKELKMFRSIADTAKAYLPEEVVEKWYKEREREKIRESLIESYATLPVKEAVTLFKKNFKPNFINFKELVKLSLRILHLR
ncbi:MAG: glycosyltransferase family 2 protein [Flavisolibacter sp.]|nr:glycosyltransferase family 2 protein [Flavisolibacter sp.]